MKNVIAESKSWTNDEALEASRYIMAQRPEVWEQMKRIEAMGGDYSTDENLPTAINAEALIHQLHPTTNILQVSDLFRAVRRLARLSTPNQ